MTTFVETIAGTPLWDDWKVEFLATHAEGPVWTKVVAFGGGLERFVRRIVADPPAVVHLHTSHYGSFARKALLLWMAKAGGVPVVLQIHAGEFPTFYRRMPRPIRWAIRGTLHQASAVVALGEGWAERLLEIAPAARVVAVPNGVPIVGRRHRTGPDEPVHVVFLGRFGDQKGTFTLVRAWAHLLRTSPDLPAARLTLAGDGEVDRIRELVSQLGLTGCVEVRAWQSPAEVAELLGSADVLTLPSRFEGQPMAVLEAMANGLCVVASRVGGIPDLVEDGESGVLVPPDDENALAKALHRVTTDPQERRRLGDAALARAREHFDLDDVWRRFDRLYRTLTAPVTEEAAGTGATGTGLTATRPRRLRVMFVVPFLRPGGAERHVVTLLPALDTKRFAPSVVCIGDEGELFGDLAGTGVPAEALDRSRLGLGAAFLELVIRMVRVRPDLVVTTGRNAELLGRLAAMVARVRHRVVWVHQCADLDLAPRGAAQRLSEVVLRSATSAYFGVAFAQVPYLTGRLGHPHAKVRVIHNGVDPDRFGFVPDPERDTDLARSLGIGPADPVVGIIASLRPEKDHGTFLRGAAAVLERVPRARFLIVGRGPLAGDMRDLADTLGISESVIFTGMRTDVSDLLALVDVVTLTSTTECFPMSTLEAMAVGRPTVCTAVGGLPEIVDDDVTGFLIPPSDPAALAGRLIDLLENPARARAMGKAGRARVEADLGLAQSAREAERHMTEVIAGRRRTRRGSTR